MRSEIVGLTATSRQEVLVGWQELARGARRVAGVLTPRQQVALEGGLEGGGGVVLLKSAVVFGDNVQDFGW